MCDDKLKFGYQRQYPIIIEPILRGTEYCIRA